MQITWYGQSCFKIQGKDVTVVTDPFFDTSGLKLKKTNADIVVVSNDNGANLRAITDCTFVVKTPGEFEVKGVFVFGIPVKSGVAGKAPSRMFRMDIEDIRILHLGALSQELSEKDLERLNRIDILLLPIGGGSVLSHEKATELATLIQPSIIIPMYYDIPGVKEKLSGVESFCKDYGVDSSDVVDKFKITKKELQEEDGRVVVLKRTL